jgi:uncharacterized protein YjlB
MHAELWRLVGLVEVRESSHPMGTMLWGGYWGACVDVTTLFTLVRGVGVGHSSKHCCADFVSNGRC